MWCNVYTRLALQRWIGGRTQVYGQWRRRRLAGFGALSARVGIAHRDDSEIAHDNSALDGGDVLDASISPMPSPSLRVSLYGPICSARCSAAATSTRPVGFSHETEERALKTTDAASDQTGEFGQSREVVDHGAYLHVDLSALIGEAAIAPQADEWFLRLVQSVARIYSASAGGPQIGVAAHPYWPQRRDERPRGRSRRA